MAKKSIDNGPGLGHFTVQKINKQTNGGLHIEHTSVYPMGDDQFDDENDKKTSSRAPIDEFKKELNSLSVYVAKILNYSSILNISSDTKLKTTPQQSKYITSLWNDYVNKITINGVKIWMAGMMVTSCEINYSIIGLSSQSMDHKTYKIDVAEGCDFVHKFEDELRDSLQKLVVYSYDYVHKRVGAQLQVIE